MTVLKLTSTLTPRPSARQPQSTNRGRTSRLNRIGTFFTHSSKLAHLSPTSTVWQGLRRRLQILKPSSRLLMHRSWARRTRPRHWHRVLKDGHRPHPPRPSALVRVGVQEEQLEFGRATDIDQSVQCLVRTRRRLETELQSILLAPSAGSSFQQISRPRW